jgi:hypothetical protein
MTAPDFKPKPLKNALQPGGRPYMTMALYLAARGAPHDSRTIRRASPI